MLFNIILKLNGIKHINLLCVEFIILYYIVNGNNDLNNLPFHQNYLEMSSMFEITDLQSMYL